MSLFKVRNVLKNSLFIRITTSYEKSKSVTVPNVFSALHFITCLFIDRENKIQKEMEYEICND